MIKASLIVAILYFLSPIAMTKIQAKAVYGDDNRQEFFKPIELPRLPIARTSAGSKKIDIVSKSEALQKMVARSSAASQTLCEGLEGSAAVGAFCAQYLPETLMTLNNLESTGLYACEVIAPKEFVFETATSLSANESAPMGPAALSANAEAAAAVAALVRVETLKVPVANQCLPNELEMSDISLIVNSITTAMK